VNGGDELRETAETETQPAASVPETRDAEDAPLDAAAPENPAQVAPGIPETDLAKILATLAAILLRLGVIEDVTGTVAKQVGYLPPQVRQLGGKVDSLMVSISESRYRSLLQSLLVIYDLVEQAARTSAAPGNDTPAVHLQNYQVLSTQLSQILTMNGLSPIPADGPFDPSVHRAIERVPVDDASRANQIVELVRPGFRTEQGVLRYAEVRVSYYAPPAIAGTGEPAAVATAEGEAEIS
jgi:molecular chaperone GrpE